MHVFWSGLVRSKPVPTRHRLFRRAFVALLIVASAASGSGFGWAQAPPRLHGSVKDPLGAVVPGAKIELLSTDARGTVLGSSMARSDGRYELMVPASGRYRLRLSAATFRETLTEPVYLSTSNETLDLALETPAVSDQITVTATGTPTPLAQSGAPVTVIPASDFPYSAEVQQPLRLVPGVQMSQAGQTGSAASLFIRGGESNANKVLLDGVPLNDVGGLVNFANIATVGIAQIEVLREPNSALYGSDALAGVVSLKTVRGVTPLPLLTYAIDGGNLGLLRNEATVSGAHQRLDYYTGFARLDTGNSVAAEAFHNATAAGNYGFAPNAKTDLRLSLRRVVTGGGQPNAFLFFGIADAAAQREQDTFVAATLSNQTTERWHNLLRYGHQALHAQFYDYAATGIPDPNGFLGKPVTLTGANGYTVSGQAIFQYPGTYPNGFRSTANRDFTYAQTDFHATPHLALLGAFKYEQESGTSLYLPDLTQAPGTPSRVDRGNYSYTLQAAGDIKSRMFYTLGSGIERNAVFGSALTPRAAVAFYVVRPGASRFLSGTKLHGSFGKGIKESSVGQQNSSLLSVLASDPKTLPLIAQYHVNSLGAEYSRTYDAGVEQLLGGGRARINATYFHNEFTNGIQFLSKDALVALGVSGPVASAADQTAFGAYVNSQAFRAQGAELELEYRLNPRVFARAGYTYLDAMVQRSFSSDAFGGGAVNDGSSFSAIPIGVYAPLVGARPFRRAPHSGYFALSYAHERVSAQLSGTLVGRRDDSTFLTDSNFGNSLLLPNRNLDGAYQRLELTADYRINSHITTYADVQNLLNEHYSEVFGYPALPINVRGGFRFSFGGETWKLR